MNSTTRSTALHALLLLLGALPTAVLAQAQAPAPGGGTQFQSLYEPIRPGYGAADPWEGFNRAIFEFNDVVDRYTLKPVAQAYLDYIPGFARKGVSNFFSNLEEPINLFNNLLQLKAEDSLITSGRLVFNTTFGVVGLFDVATGFGLPQKREDFGQTLGYWGVDSGPYVVLPLLGPNTVRDSSRFITDSQLPSGYHLVESPEVYALLALRGIDMRAQLIPAEQALIGEDRYRAIRNAYLQRREYQVKDGQVSDPFASDDDLLEDF
ncbi:MlaA family lipoprotein [Hydrocarboniclastica marina]|uniref:VacJ family lipoprotein n=1 Tax=Hydrocarboniclastica marina TaxID=2259620 RepID=A0A4P7XGU4_9ALTE|nr:VacJ family lipoprotein [Hydrocarboniclastica marina]QCF26241.1 VacJ family lipoprotein [Hydrocarboniclastica marina]